MCPLLEALKTNSQMNRETFHPFQLHRLSLHPIEPTLLPSIADAPQSSNILPLHSVFNRFPIGEAHVDPSP